MKHPRLTVSITYANRPQLLREALQSVLAQTFTDYGVLVSDNGTDDGCQKVVDEFGDSRIDYRRHCPPIAPYQNWHYALSTPTTEYVAFLHDDDVWQPDHLTKAVALLEQYPEAGIYTCRVEYFGDRSYPGLPFGLEAVQQPMVVPPEQAALLWSASNLAQCSAVVLRRRLMNGLDWGPQNDMYGLDWYLWSQIVAQSHWIYRPEACVRYRLHAQSGTKNLGSTSISARGHYATRKVIQTFLPFIRKDREAFFVAVSRWPVFVQSRLIVPLLHIGAGRELWSLGREICRRNPAILSDRTAIEHCRLAGKLGLRYLHFAELIDRFRGRWWPKKRTWSP